MSTSSQAHEAEFQFSSPNRAGAPQNERKRVDLHMSELMASLSKDQDPTSRDELCYRLRQQSLLGDFGRSALQTREPGFIDGDDLYYCDSTGAQTIVNTDRTLTPQRTRRAHSNALILWAREDGPRR